MQKIVPRRRLWPLVKCAEVCLAQLDISLTPCPELENFVAHDAEVRSLSIGKKSRRVFITGGNDRKVKLWAIGKQTPLLVCAPYVNDTAINLFFLAILKF
jgi:WD40 repeat protein